MACKACISYKILCFDIAKEDIGETLRDEGVPLGESFASYHQFLEKVIKIMNEKCGECNKPSVP